MTVRPPQWTRRQFSQAVAAASLIGWNSWAATPRNQAGFAFVGSSPNPADGALHVFRVSGARWIPVQTLPSAAPAHLVLHPTIPVLYAVHAVDLWNDLPRGAISAYAIGPATGLLTLLHTQPLSLSATCPRHAAISPDGRHLLVAAERGGLYNLLPIAPNGALEAPSAIRKEFGLDEGPAISIAAPRQVVFHPDGATIFTADPGQQAINTFSFDHHSIHLQRRLRPHPGAGPSSIALSPTGDWLYAQHATDGSITTHPIHPRDNPAPVHYARQPGPALMAMQPNGRFLLTASDRLLTSLSIAPRTSPLSEVSTILLPEPLKLLTCPPDGAHLLATSRSSGQVLHFPFHATLGTLGKPEAVAHVPAASSLLLRPALL